MTTHALSCPRDATRLTRLRVGGVDTDELAAIRHR
jgi:hypothetical protein